MDKKVLISLVTMLICFGTYCYGQNKGNVKGHKDDIITISVYNTIPDSCNGYVTIFQYQYSTSEAITIIPSQIKNANSNSFYLNIKNCCYMSRTDAKDAAMDISSTVYYQLSQEYMNFYNFETKKTVNTDCYKKFPELKEMSGGVNFFDMGFYTNRFILDMQIYAVQNGKKRPCNDCFEIQFPPPLPKPHWLNVWNYFVLSSVNDSILYGLTDLPIKPVSIMDFVVLKPYMPAQILLKNDKKTVCKIAVKIKISCRNQAG